MKLSTEQQGGSLIKNPVTRLLFVGLGWMSIALGVIGLFVPLLPTTPFLLLAAYFFSNSSQRFYLWMVSHPVLGKPVQEWQKHGVIRPKAKALSFVLMTSAIWYAVFFRSIPLVAKMIMVAVWLGVSTFVLSRPSHPKSDS